MSRESIFHATAALLPDPLRPIEDWGKILGDTAAVTAMLDRLLHHAHIIKCGPQSWRTREKTGLRNKDTEIIVTPSRTAPYGVIGETSCVFDQVR